MLSLISDNKTKDLNSSTSQYIQLPIKNGLKKREVLKGALAAQIVFSMASNALEALAMFICIPTII